MGFGGGVGGIGDVLAWETCITGDIKGILDELSEDSDKRGSASLSSCSLSFVLRLERVVISSDFFRRAAKARLSFKPVVAAAFPSCIAFTKGEDVETGGAGGLGRAKRWPIDPAKDEERGAGSIVMGEGRFLATVKLAEEE
jgi:hypothetical protein